MAGLRRGRNRTPAAQATDIGHLDDVTAATIFQTAEEKRHTLDQMMWQVPAISLTAQSFLLTIALGSGVPWLGRITAAGLGLVAAAAAIQLLLKHRYHEKMHSQWLEVFAAARGWPPLHGPGVEQFAYQYRGGSHPWRALPRWKLAKHRSPKVWVFALAAFGFLDFAILVAGLIGLLHLHLFDLHLSWKNPVR